MGGRKGTSLLYKNAPRDPDALTVLVNSGLLFSRNLFSRSRTLKQYQLGTKTRDHKVPPEELEHYLQANRALAFPGLRIIAFLGLLGAAGAFLYLAVWGQSSWETIWLTSLVFPSIGIAFVVLQPRELWRRNMCGFALVVKQTEEVVKMSLEKLLTEHAFQYHITALRYLTGYDQPLDMAFASSNRSKGPDAGLRDAPWGRMVGYIPLQGSWGWCGMDSGNLSKRWFFVRHLCTVDPRRTMAVDLWHTMDVKDRDGMKISFALENLPQILRASDDRSSGHLRFLDLFVRLPPPPEEVRTAQNLN